MAIPFPTPQGGHIIGQPFALSDLSVPVNVTLTCNCAVPSSVLVIVASAPVKCPACSKTYLVTFNPQTGQLSVAMATETAKEPS